MKATIRNTGPTEAWPFLNGILWEVFTAAHSRPMCLSVPIHRNNLILIKLCETCKYRLLISFYCIFLTFFFFFIPLHRLLQRVNIRGFGGPRPLTQGMSGSTGWYKGWPGLTWVFQHLHPELCTWFPMYSNLFLSFWKSLRYLSRSTLQAKCVNDLILSWL